MCNACKTTNAFFHEHGRKAFDQPIDPIKRARYLRAKRTGKTPADPAYAKHVHAATFVPNLEFTRAELADRSVRVFKRDPWAPNVNSAKADRFFPESDVTDVQAYVRMFETLNGLKPTLGEFACMIS